MFKNYFKTAFRNLWRNKNFTVINITGLAVGIAVCLVIFLIIQFELSFDDFHKKKDRIYRVLTELHNADGIRRSRGVPFPLPITLHNDFPSLKSSAITEMGNAQLILPDETTGGMPKKFKEEEGVFYAEPSLFEIFDFPLIAGDYKTLKDPNTVIITKETAERYFGDWKLAIGKPLKINGNQFFGDNNNLYKITGILATIPKNTDLQIKMVASYATLKNFTGSTDWVSVASDHACYVLLPEGTSPSFFNEQLKLFGKKYKKDNAANHIQYLQSLSQVHYNDEPGNFLGRTISKKLINVLWLIAAFILLIACVNFVNLSTALAVNRAKEVGVRKVLGGNKRQLQLQFFSETAIITISAIVLAVIITVATLPFLNSVLKLPLSFDINHNPSILVFLAAIAVAVIGMAGFYPAIVLSRFNPITALKSKIAAGRTKGISLRRGLVVFQFVIAQALIVGTLIIVKQMDYFRNRPMGFDKNAIVNVSFPDDSIAKTKLDYLKNKLLAIDGVKSVSFSFASPADDGNWNSNLRFNHAEKETDWETNLKWADADYLRTYNIPLVAGRNLYPSDTVKEYLVNETFIRRLGLGSPADVLNKDIDMWNGQLKGTIVGVMKDFNALSLRRAITPVLVTTVREFYSKAGIKMETAKIPAVLKKVESAWNEVYPEYVYEPKFFDATIENFYIQESRLSNLYKIFAVLAIFLSCLGLYGLASFMAVQRIKEVGIRKVLGASVNNIILLFSKEFLLLIGIAFVIAAPLAWYYMHDWLQDFVYRIHISWWILLLAGGIAVLVALCTISFQAIKAAVANPVKSLRTE
ncbi:MAG: ABC transporter permease [Bacteroidota bacterium]|nr:ABC transporter permease [Bacteroidota bacterium]